MRARWAICFVRSSLFHILCCAGEAASSAADSAASTSCLLCAHPEPDLLKFTSAIWSPRKLTPPSEIQETASSSRQAAA